MYRHVQTTMGFWGKLQEYYDKTPWARLGRANEKLQKLYDAYETTHNLITLENRRISSCIYRLNERIAETKSILADANELLFPRGIFESEEGGISPASDELVTLPKSSLSLGLDNRLVDSSSQGLASIALGTSTALAAWASVQVMGTASTGAAIVGLHGVAASNAGWAFFGGGSLASGGGGMALGHLVLPGLGAAVAVAFSALFSSLEANVVHQVIRELRRAERHNNTILTETKQNAERLEDAERFFNLQSESLNGKISDANSYLFKFGFASRLAKCLRYLFTGRFYSRKDELVLDQVRAAVKTFMSAFGTGYV